MNVDPCRILQHLSSTGFELGYVEQGGTEAVFAKRHVDGLFERMSISKGFSHRPERVDLVCAWIECTIVPGRTALKGMAEVACLTEIASEPETGWTTLTSDEEIRKWESTFCAVAPTRAHEFAIRVGPVLLSQTKDARDAASSYLGKCHAAGATLEEMLRGLKGQMDRQQESDCRRIVKGADVCIPNGAAYYNVAAHAIALFANEVEPDSDWLERTCADADDRGLLIRLQILASRLACEPGW